MSFSERCPISPLKRLLFGKRIYQNYTHIFFFELFSHQTYLAVDSIQRFKSFQFIGYNIETFISCFNTQNHVFLPPASPPKEAALFIDKPPENTENKPNQSNVTFSRVVVLSPVSSLRPSVRPSARPFVHSSHNEK